MSDPKTSNRSKAQNAIRRATAVARAREGAELPANRITEKCHTPLVLTIQRLWEWPKNPKAKNSNARQGGTIGVFDLTIRGDKSPLVVGFTLEAAGPSTQQEGTDQRVPPGNYHLVNNPGSKEHHPFRLVQLSRHESDATLGERYAINIHAGYDPSWLTGCICVGEGWTEEGIVVKQGKQGDRSLAYPTLRLFPGDNESSDRKLEELKNAITRHAQTKSVVAYDGDLTPYPNCTWYSNVTVIVREIQPRYIYFTIAYMVDNHVFEKEARQWQLELLRSNTLSIEDIFVMEVVRTPEEFVRSWGRIFEICMTSKLEVKIGRIYAHSSRAGETDGLELSPDSEARVEIDRLPLLTWTRDATLSLHRCGGSVKAHPLLAPMGSFARAQHVYVDIRSDINLFCQRCMWHPVP